MVPTSWRGCLPAGCFIAQHLFDSLCCTLHIVWVWARNLYTRGVFHCSQACSTTTFVLAFVLLTLHAHIVRCGRGVYIPGECFIAQHLFYLLCTSCGGGIYRPGECRTIRCLKPRTFSPESPTAAPCDALAVWPCCAPPERRRVHVRRTRRSARPARRCPRTRPAWAARCGGYR